MRTLGVVILLLALCPLGELRADVSASRAALAQLTSKVELFTLSNGLRVIFYRRGEAPVFAGALTVRVGGTDEPEGLTGISHMLEHMAFKGTPRLGTKDYKRERPLLDELEIYEERLAAGGALDADAQARYGEVQKELAELWKVGEFAQQFDTHGGVGMNATTDTERTRYFVELPRSAFEFWCDIESERLLHPVMRQFYQERDVVMEERRMRYDDDPANKLYELLIGAAYQRHRYRNPVIGHASDIQALTARKVDEFRRRYYVPSNIVVSLVGDVDAERDLPVVRRYFERLDPGADAPRPTVVEPPQRGERRVVYVADAAPAAYLAYHKPNYPHPDDAPLTLFAHLLAGTKISPLYVELVKQRRLAASVDVEEGPGSAYPNLVMFSLTPRSPHTNEELISGFDHVLREFQQSSLSEETLQIAKRSIAVQYLDQLKSNSSLALDLASSELLYGKWRAIIDWYDEAMQVRVADVQRVAKTYFVDSNRTIALLESERK